MTEPAGKDTVPLIELREVEAWRGNTCVFEALNLRIAQDQHVAVLGPNGAGKSTLLKLLAREIHPRPKPGSRLAILGETRFETRRYQARLGLVSHDLQLGFPPAATVREAMLSGFSVSLGVSGVPYRFSDMEQEQTSARLDQVGMAGLADRPYGALSTGQQRRCLLARALVT
ncbi:MAG: ATP-binding cassette domain-containing protein, partial [Pseudomonadota bacterium]